MIALDNDDHVGQISTIDTTSVKRGGKQQRPVPLDHHIFSKGEWRRTKVKSHPRVPLSITMQGCLPVDISAVADSGAQSDLWSLDEFLRAGYTMDNLSPVSLSLNAANKSPIKIDGAFFAYIKGQTSNARTVCCRSMVYVSRDVKSLYLSYDTMLSLGIIDSGFPQVGKFTPAHQIEYTRVHTINGEDRNEMTLSSICGDTKDDGDVCDCPKRTQVPDRPTALPFPCVPENIPRMRSWLLEQYRSSSLNKCPHQRLPVMTGPSIEIHLKDNVKPVANHKAASVPVYWQDQVHADLKRDEALGVIEPVPIGEPVEWCHRMVVTRKPDGSPRRTVDLSPLNKHCRRETIIANFPFNSLDASHATHGRL